MVNTHHRPGQESWINTELPTPESPELPSGVSTPCVHCSRRSTLEYGEVVWDAYLKQDTEKLERIQRQAARFITRDYRSREPGCIGRMLDFLGLPPLEERRRQLRLSMLYKIAKGLVPALPADAFLTVANRNRGTKRGVQNSQHSKKSSKQQQPLLQSTPFQD